jgi:glutamate-1-semialdehyde 2,1-aminomutase
MTTATPDSPATLHERDLAFFHQHLRSWVPTDIFDVHTHPYRGFDAFDSVPKDLHDSAGMVGIDRMRWGMSRWMGDRVPQSGLYFGFPKVDVEMPGANRFTQSQTLKYPGSKALLLIRPTDDPAVAQQQVTQAPFAGFKVYHVYSKVKPTWDSPIDDFLPEWAWEIADGHGLVLMLHMVRTRALADEGNQRSIISHCRRYPNAKLVLAHCARSFCTQHTLESIHTLADLDNVWFDMSAVCESGSMEAILRTFGTRRLMYGSDFPVSEFRGRCVSIGDGFLWLDDKNVDWSKSPFAQHLPVGLESLMALKQACQALRLRDSDVQRIFADNARLMLGLQRGTGDLTQGLYNRARQIIPGGTQLLSKRPEMYAPQQWPAYFAEARGCEVYDLDGNRFLDMTTGGIGSCVLGYADPDVVDAVTRRVQLGSMSTLNAAEEVHLADLLLKLHPWSQQVRYARSGGEAMSVAVRIARAATGRDVVAFCGYHGWSDWYLAANLGDGTGQLDGHLMPGLDPHGVPRGLAGTALPFKYNQIDELHAIVKQQGARLAAVVMEPTRSTPPAPGFLESVRELCDRNGSALVFDEITTGLRMHAIGLHMKYGVHPDIAVFAKALGNGHPMAAILGRDKVMQAAQVSFISSTYWTEALGPTAALTTVGKVIDRDVPGHIVRIGASLQRGLSELAATHRAPLTPGGYPALITLKFDHAQAAAIQTLFTVRMLKRGILAGGGIYPTLAHQDGHVQRYLAAADKVLGEIRQAMDAGDIEGRIGGPVKHSGFARLT